MQNSAIQPPLILSLMADKHHAVLDAALRQMLVKALILLRNKQQLPPTQLLPLLFKLFRVQVPSPFFPPLCERHCPPLPLPLPSPPMRTSAAASSAVDTPRLPPPTGQGAAPAGVSTHHSRHQEQQQAATQ